LGSIVTTYHGIDFSEEFVKVANNNFKNNKNIQFFYMSATDIDTRTLLSVYDLIIVTGVVMYINDSNISRFFSYCNKLTGVSSAIYFQESVSILPYRLTLSNFDSIELKSKYSAIYRTSKEYEKYFSEYLSDWQIKATDILLDKDTGAREETNARYWFLKRKKR
jgi:cyclopropane fatty-acyl-phospholipid synthase-like methyltransferase